MRAVDPIDIGQRYNFLLNIIINCCHYKHLDIYQQKVTPDMSKKVRKHNDTHIFIIQPLKFKRFSLPFTVLST